MCTSGLILPWQSAVESCICGFRCVRQQIIRLRSFTFLSPDSGGGGSGGSKNSGITFVSFHVSVIL